MKSLLKYAKIILGASSMVALAHGQKPTMVIDEWSSTSLSLTFEGTTIWGTRDDPVAEFWDVSNLGQFGIDLTADVFDPFPNVIPGTADDLFGVGWLEPDGSGAYNTIDSVGWGNQGYPLVTDFGIGSDLTGTPAPFNMLANGAVYSDNVLPFAIQFNDHGDSVPDGGTTCAMLGAAFTGLAALRRRFAR
jgi:hypothetical protein